MSLLFDSMLKIYNIKSESDNIGALTMSFREKILWTTLLAGIAPYLWYFGAVGIAFASGAGLAGLSIGGLISAIIVGLVVMIIAVSVVAVVNRRDGTMMPDEREHRIESRGIVLSYHMLCTGVILVIGGAWFGWNSLVVIHVLAFAFILSEMTRVIVEIHGLRRGY